MSWTERIPMMAPKRRFTLTPTQYAERDVEQNVVLSAYLRKLTHMHRRWFVLYQATETHPAHLEYFDNEKKWKSGAQPSREIILKNCLNICKKQDSRASKNKPVVAIYTYEDCLSILFDDEQELRNWLIQLLSHQKGEGLDGKIPKPKFEHMWQVHVKAFKPEDPLNSFHMTGQYRLCVTPEDLKFFSVGSETPISFPIICLRSCACKDRLFQLRTGRSSVSGAGTLFIYCEDTDIASNLNKAALDAMDLKRKNPETLRLLSHDTRQAREPTGDSHNKSSSYRPRSESCSEIDKTKSSSFVPKSSAPHFHHPLPPTSYHGPHEPAIFSSSRDRARIRTTSEGNHLEQQRRRTGPPGSKTGSLFSSGSPLSPSPGSYVSSESAGSSNSLDDSEVGVTERRHVSMNEPPTATIFEESSAESCVDPNNPNVFGAGSGGDSNEMSPPSNSRLPPFTTGAALLCSSSHVRTSSDTVQYTSVEVSAEFGAPAGAQKTAAPGVSTAYATIVNLSEGAAGASSSEYMVMTPTNPSSSCPASSSSSLKRHASLDQPSGPSAAAYATEQRRLAMLGLIANEDQSSSVTGSGSIATTTAASPSSQSSINPLEDDTGAYHVMSPVGAKGFVPKKSSVSAPSNDDEYIAMSPVSTLDAKPKTIPLMSTVTDDGASGDYLVMSPVREDLEKLRRISEEDTPPPPLSAITPVHLSGARPKQQLRADGSKRSSFCSDGGGAPGFPDAPWDPDMEPEEPEDPDYAPIDYSSSSASAIPIPVAAMGAAGRISPASSRSLGVSHGTPLSTSGAAAAGPVSDDPLPFESKAVAYLRDDDDHELRNQLPARAYSVSTSAGIAAAAASSSNSSLSCRSRTGSVNSRVASGNRLSPASAIHCKAGQSPNFITRLDQWFRSRAGSVPSRPNLAGRRRHRTQSEGENKGTVEEGGSGSSAKG